MNASQTRKAAAEWLAYQRSPQASLDRQIDRQRRLAADKATGHSPRCTLSGCAADCNKVRAS